MADLTHDGEARIKLALIEGLQRAAQATGREAQQAFERHRANELALSRARGELADIEDTAGCQLHRDPLLARDDPCAFCRHPRGEHRAAAGGRLLICRRHVKLGAHDMKLCGCRAFREVARG